MLQVHGAKEVKILKRYNKKRIMLSARIIIAQMIIVLSPSQ
jgi:hypothetical protein